MTAKSLVHAYFTLKMPFKTSVLLAPSRFAVLQRLQNKNYNESKQFSIA